MSEEIINEYTVSCNQQLERWLQGESIHNSQFDECCPDFSCCGQPLWPQHRRQLYMEGNSEVRSQLNMMSLSSLFNGAQCKVPVHVTDGSIESYYAVIQ